MRLVSLCPSSTETVFALGCGAALVGRTRFCVEPRGEVERIERLGGTKDPDVARILALAPELVLMNAEENRREDAEALQSGGLRVHSSFPRGPADVPPLLLELGRLLGRARAAEALARTLEERLAAARAAARGSPGLRFLYLIWRRPWMAAGADTYASALLAVAGGENVLARTAEDARYPALALVDWRAAGIERVFLTSEPYRFRDSHRAEVAKALGLAPEAVVLADGQALTWHGARTLAGLAHAEALCAR